MDSITLKKTGYTIQGTATISLLDGSEGEICMNESFIPSGKLTYQKLLSCINDGKYGGSIIESVEVDIYEQFENNHKEYNRTVWLSERICQNRQDKFNIGI